MRLDQGCPPLDPRPGFSTPVGLWDVLNRMLQPEPFDRFRSAADARAALAELFDKPYEQLTPDIDGVGTSTSDFMQREQVTDDEASILVEHRKSLLTSTFESSMGHQPPEAPLRTATLVGRDNLLLSLSRGLAHWVSAPAPGVLVLAGAKGSGKTRLVREMLSPFIAQGEIEANHHQWRYGASMRATMIAITGAIGLRSDNLKEHLEWYLKGHGVEESARPNIIAWLLEDDRGRPTDRDAQMATDFLRACCDERPFILALDGVEEIDDQIIGMINAVRKAQLPIIIVLAGSDPKLVGAQRSPSWLNSARRDLEPLNTEELGRITDELIDLPHSVRDRLVRQASGNPKELFYLIYEMRRNGEVIPAAPRWQIAPEGWIPVDAAAAGVYNMGSIDMSVLLDEDA